MSNEDKLHPDRHGAASQADPIAEAAAECRRAIIDLVVEDKARVVAELQAWIALEEATFVERLQ
jgi:hypothetical protein